MLCIYIYIYECYEPKHEGVRCSDVCGTSSTSMKQKAFGVNAALQRTRDYLVSGDRGSRAPPRSNPSSFLQSVELCFIALLANAGGGNTNRPGRSFRWKTIN